MTVEWWTLDHMVLRTPRLKLAARQQVEREWNRRIQACATSGGWLWSNAGARQMGGAHGFPPLIAVHPTRGFLLLVQPLCRGGDLHRDERFWRDAVLQVAAAIWTDGSNVERVAYRVWRPPDEVAVAEFLGGLTDVIPASSTPKVTA